MNTSVITCAQLEQAFVSHRETGYASVRWRVERLNGRGGVCRGRAVRTAVHAQVTSVVFSLVLPQSSRAPLPCALAVLRPHPRPAHEMARAGHAHGSAPTILPTLSSTSFIATCKVSMSLRWTVSRTGRKQRLAPADERFDWSRAPRRHREHRLPHTAATPPPVDSIRKVVKRVEKILRVQMERFAELRQLLEAPLSPNEQTSGPSRAVAANRERSVSLTAGQTQEGALRLGPQLARWNDGSVVPQLTSERLQR